jgi:hypothetical protein
MGVSVMGINYTVEVGDRAKGKWACESTGTECARRFGGLHS